MLKFIPVEQGGIALSKAKPPNTILRAHHKGKLQNQNALTNGQPNSQDAAEVEISRNGITNTLQVQGDLCMPLTQ